MLPLRGAKSWRSRGSSADSQPFCFRTEARTLKSFCHAVGDLTMQDVSVDKMAAFLAGTGPITRFWAHNGAQA
jgi:hypothetical protein